MSTHTYRHKGEVIRSSAIGIDPAWNDMARHGSQQLLQALHRYFLKHGDGRR